MSITLREVEELLLDNIKLIDWFKYHPVHNSWKLALVQKALEGQYKFLDLLVAQNIITKTIMDKEDALISLIGAIDVEDIRLISYINTDQTHTLDSITEALNGMDKPTINSRINKLITLDIVYRTNGVYGLHDVYQYTLGEQQ